jgi:hypothetical protein
MTESPPLIYDFLSPEALLVGFIGTFLLLALLVRSGGLKTWFDPMTLPYFQVIFTGIVLGIRVIPWPHILCLILLLAFLARSRHRPSRLDPQDSRQWEQLIPPLIALSVVMNLNLIANKGFVLFQEDIGAARVVFYEGWGLTQRLNALSIYLFGIYAVKQSLHRRIPRYRLAFMWLWTLFLIGTLGSKGGLLVILICYGCVKIFHPYKISLRQSATMISTVVLGIVGMFWAYFGNQVWVQFAMRMIANADGPFYYFSLPTPIHVSAFYPLQNLMVATRLLPELPEMSLGPAINLHYFNFYSPNFGPNGQIFCESQAAFGSLFPLYYLLTALLIAWLLRKPRSPYTLALFSSVAGPLLIDGQYAFSLVLNILMAYALRTLVTLAFSSRPRRSSVQAKESSSD